MNKEASRASAWEQINADAQVATPSVRNASDYAAEKHGPAAAVSE